ncbi:MAG TPA: hypothetical protein PLP25_09745 [Candidatus Limiplasma sp.]|nr:hypothetical protein [Candidatus Limiplasma sp.]HPS82123.1 hypothetical protein [Candidatus Limiplasma sp.]
MKRKWLTVLCLLAVAALLTGCDSQQQTGQTFAEVTQYLGPAVTDTPVPVNSDVTGVSDGDTTGDGSDSIFADNPYVVDPSADTAADPDAQAALGEESGQTSDTVVYGQADADATVYPYAGSSPIPLIPIDAPSPTPRTALAFTYVPYDVTSLGLSFQAPAGWVPDDSVNEMYTLTEPEAQIKDGQLGVINVYAVPVNSNYNDNSLVAEVKQRLSTIGSTNFVEWKPSLTASRYLMGGKGIYANYSGTLANGVQVGGRIHATYIDNVLYCIQITYPLNFKDDYLNVFAQLRESIKRTGTK